MSIPSATAKTPGRGSSDENSSPRPKPAAAPPENSANAADSPDKDAIGRELHQILASHWFHASKRSQEFLNFVVRHRLDENSEPLKERTIGTLLFKRPANYATGDDSVVRVQAGEVRRRLDQYYQAPPAEARVRIELPLGSYTPEFSWLLRTSAPPGNSVQVPDSIPAVEAAPSAPPPALTKRRAGRLIALIAVAAVVLLATVFWVRHTASAESALNRFWSPILATPRPLLICLPEPVLYRPSIALYKRHELTPHEFDSEVDRMNGRPHLLPDEKMKWGDMVEFTDFGVSKGDVKAAFRLAAVVTRLGKDNEVRVGNDYGWDDLRNGPAIVIGAFSNPWTMKLISGLHFSFVEDHGVFHIQEQGAQDRSWYDELDRNAAVAVDYGLVTRLVNSGTGQFTVAIAGITAPGSEAAAEVATSSDDLQRALGNTDWARKNVQIVVKTSVTEGVAGPPQIVALYLW
ncbi:MAG TPA: hypothetical protein VGF88_07070 [Acidobacteriaceae bacterium]|jgi:hypothetical protein